MLFPSSSPVPGIREPIEAAQTPTPTPTPTQTQTQTQSTGAFFGALRCVGQCEGTANAATAPV
jgi:hypothetical protein